MEGVVPMDIAPQEDISNLDVEQLNDDGWRRVLDSNRLIKLGSLGEGAGGAVTRCMLQGGKTLFALKVWLMLGVL
jgi:mitogen-activated protein kinase kinase